MKKIFTRSLVVAALSLSLARGADINLPAIMSSITASNAISNSFPSLIFDKTHGYPFSITNIPSSVLSASYNPNFSSPQTYFVSTNGNDNTGSRGDYSKPWKTIDAVMNLATNGNIIYISPGFYDTANFMPNLGVTVLGINPETTIVNLHPLTNSYQISGNEDAIISFDNITIQGITLRNTNNYGWVGLVPSYQLNNGSNSASITNVVFRSCTLTGVSDVITFTAFLSSLPNGMAFGLTVDGCRMLGTWDLLACLESDTLSGTNNSVVIENTTAVTDLSHGTSNGGNPNTGAAGNFANFSSTLGGLISFKNVDWTVINAGSGGFFSGTPSSATTILFNNVNERNVMSNGIALSSQSFPNDAINTSRALGASVNVGAVSWSWTQGTTNNGSSHYAPFNVIQTNFISGKLYTNSYGNSILVSTTANITNASIAGLAQMALRMPGNVTNIFGNQTIVGTLATTNVGSISGIVTNLGTYVFTNLSSGAGNGAGIIGGQIIVY